MDDLREPNAVVLEDTSSSSSLGRDVWARAEQVTSEIIRQVQPTVVSEERRRDVIDYVQRLVKGNLGCEVFRFGSVPLKTYLPDGDIDLTAFCGFNLEESFANDVYRVLEREDHNPVAEFVVKDVQYIRAEVKLVKCLVQNIVVDISFNQIGGLCALCFLEEVDRLIGKDHLFKRSIILIKAWCYYESRILGAHHGLISTYALETLVLYIFHVFHSSLSGPLAVLYRFLDYFSKFDWENYCVSLSGPVHFSSLPEIVAERKENEGDNLLLSQDFVRECVNKFSVPSRGAETNSRTFMQKHLNIVDPLKENNNLGRSVSKGNFFRIRSAFSYGARKLGQILLQPQENIADEVRRFFTNTLDRHGQGLRPDVQDFTPMSRCNGFVPDLLLNGEEPSQEESYSHELESFNSNGLVSECRLGSEDTKDLSTCRIQKLSISSDADKSSPSMAKGSNSPLGFIPHAPHLYFFHQSENRKLENGDFDGNGDNSNVISFDLENSHVCNGLDLFTSMAADASICRDVRSLPDLSGHVDSHLDSLRYGRWWYDYDNFLTTSLQPVHVAPPPLFQRKNQWDAIRQSLHSRRDMVPHVNVNGVVPRPAFYPMNPPVVAGAAFGIDEMPKARGTGTYFPITNHYSYRDRSSQGKGRTQGQLKFPRTNGQAPTPLDRSPQVRSPVHQGMGKPRCSDFYETSPRGKVFEETNSFVHASQKAVPPPLEISLPGEGDRQPDSSSSPGSHSGESVFVGNNARLAVQSYRLKDEEDFPPLST